MSALLEVKNLSISFGGVHAVDNLSFTVEKGEILGLIGPNGAGKSTCVNLITGAYKPDHGEIYFNGQQILPKHSIQDRVRMGMGRTFQTPKPFGNMTTFDNVLTIAIQTRPFSEARVKSQEVLELTGLGEYANMMSSKLPIEMRKRLDLARILVNDPQFIMMDEVMAGLNPIEMQEGIRLIRKLNEMGITILYIEHVMKTVIEVCSRVLVITEGRFLSEGKAEEVLKQPEVIAAYIGGVHNHADT